MSGQLRFLGSIRILRNLGSSYANVGLMAVITLLLVPLYAQLLGPTLWGVVALCLSLQGLLFALDVALAPLMLREVSRAAQNGHQRLIYQHFRRVYGGFALALMAVAQLVIYLREHGTLLGDSPISSDLAWALRMVLVQFVFQFTNQAAIGYWNGLQRQAFANGRLALFLVLKHLAALLLLFLYPNSVAAFLLPFAALCAIEFVINDRRARMETTSSPPGLPHGVAFLSQREIAAYGLPALLGVLAGQIDRICLSLILNAEQYGVYFLASHLLLSVLSLQVPLQRAFLPAMAISSSGNQLTRSMLRISIGFLVIPCLLVAVFAETALFWWLRDAALSHELAPTFRLMLIGAALMALYAPCGAQLLNEQRYATLTKLNGAILLTQVTVLLALTPTLGMLSGGIGWLCFGALQAGFAIWHMAKVQRG